MRSRLPHAQQAQKIKSLRIARGLSQAQLAKLVGVTRVAIYYYESQGCNSLATAGRLAIALGVSLETLRV